VFLPDSTNQERHARLQEIVARELAGERVLWQGAPRSTRRFSPGKAEGMALAIGGLVVFFWFWLAFHAWLDGNPPTFFLILGFGCTFLVWQTFKYESGCRTCIHYAITDRRAVIFELLPQVRIRSLDASAIRGITQRRIRGRYGGDLCFEPSVIAKNPDDLILDLEGFLDLDSLAEPAAALQQMLRLRRAPAA
jgi:hypothetical protein